LIIKKLSELIPISTVIPYYTKMGTYSTYLITPQFIVAFTLNKNPEIINNSTTTEIIPPVWTIDIETSLPAGSPDMSLIHFPINILADTLNEMETNLESIYTTYETMLINFISIPKN